MTRRSCLVFLAVVGFATCGRAGGSDDGVAARLVQVQTTSQSYDELMPWQKQPPTARAGYGIVVRDGLVITPEHLVRDQTLVELRRPLSGEKIPATVTAADWQAGLALLAYPTGAVPGVGEAPAMAAPLRKDDTVLLHQFNRTSDIECGPGRVMLALVTAMPAAPAVGLQFTVLTDLGINGTGAPVSVSNQLAGMVLDYEPNTRTARVLPARTLQRFTDDVLAPPYDGFAGAGFLWRPLVDPVKRRYLGLGDAHRGQGILVVSTMPHSPADGLLQPNDVILACHGHTIDDMGFYNDDTYGRMSFVYLIKEQLLPGVGTVMRVMRDGAELECPVVLARRDDGQDLVPEDVAGRPPAYLVEGGLVLRELTGRFLRAHGPEWTRRVDPRLVYMYNRKRYDAAAPGDRVVILAGVLPDPINVDYHQLGNEVVTHVNDTPVRNMADVLACAGRDGHVTRVRLQGIGVDLVLDPAELDTANQRIAAQYGIGALRYPPPAEETPR